MKNMKHIVSVMVAALAAGSMAVAVAPTVNASEQDVVVSSRSFPKVTSVKKNLFAESTSSTAEQNSNWGGIETLNVPQTQSQAEKDAAAAQKAAEQKAQSQAQAASRSQQRQSLDTSSSSTTTAVVPPASASASSLASFATQFVGAPYVSGGTSPAGWDCSGFVQYVFAQFGISLPRTSGAQATVGTAVPSLAQAQPGDILANGNHAAIYIGNGLIVNALNPYQGTQITSVAAFGGAGFAIRRVL